MTTYRTTASTIVVTISMTASSARERRRRLSRLFEARMPVGWSILGRKHQACGPSGLFGARVGPGRFRAGLRRCLRAFRGRPVPPRMSTRGAWTRTSGSWASVTSVTRSGIWRSDTCSVASKSSRALMSSSSSGEGRPAVPAPGPCPHVQQVATELVDGGRLADDLDRHVDDHLLGHLHDEEVGVDRDTRDGMLLDPWSSTGVARPLPTLRSTSALRPAWRRSVANSRAST